MTTTTHPTLCVVRIRLCSCKCRNCTSGHEYTAPMDAERIGRRKVRITQPDSVWFGAVVTSNDFEFVSDAEQFLLMAAEGRRIRMEREAKERVA